MYADAVFLHLRSWDRFANTEEDRWSVTVPVVSRVDLDFDELQAFVVDVLGAQPGSEHDPIEGPGPGPYTISVKEERFEAGGSGAILEIVLSIQEWVGMLGWGVLGGMIADYLSKRADKDE